ncbi:MAG: alpha-L-fucosidase [Ignavibacteriales bacterium]|nr:alpha-L-fucosidase [Ignavibacteriales bacterium]
MGNIKTYLLLAILLMNCTAFSQQLQNNFVIINAGDTREQIIQKAANVTPSARQYEWQKLEMTGFVHFGINTFDVVEWGQRNTDITKFNPTEIDVKQWVKILKDAGIKLIILTTKHHDGFCLWQTKYTDYSIANTPFQNGKGDIVRDLSNACREAGLKFGVYLSPWDMHEEKYGTPEYNQHFMHQLTELLTNYGGISEVWFDGANGEGANGKKQVYDWQSYYQLIRKLQPNAVIAIMGPDVRWVGTESGYGRQTEWSVLPGASTNQEAIAANSQQQSLDGAFVPHDLMDEDLGSRNKIEKASSLIWYPAEIDVSIRPRWFYNTDDDELVKSPYKLVDIYYNSVGLNGVLLLNVPPDKRGLIHDNDIKALQGMRYILDETFKNNLAVDGIAKVSNEGKGNEIKFILDNNPETFWTTEENISSALIEIELNGEKTFNRVMLQENILAGQRIEKFHLEYWGGKQWNQFFEATTIGYKRLLRFPAVTTNRIKIIIDECRTNPTLASFGLYEAPPEIKFEPEGAAFADSTSFKLTSDVENVTFYYTLDCAEPDEQSLKYSGEVTLNKTTTVTAIAISNSGKRSLPVKMNFNKAKYGIEYKSDYDKKYQASGIYSLVDGIAGTTNFNDGRWQGFNGNDLDVVIDLHKSKKINKISTRFLSDAGSFIFLPASVEYSVSKDGKDFTLLSELKNTPPENDKSAIIKTFESEPQNISGRYIRVKAKNIGVCPAWHKGAGEKAWLFADEISVE